MGNSNQVYSIAYRCNSWTIPTPTAAAFYLDCATTSSVSYLPGQLEAEKQGEKVGTMRPRRRLIWSHFAGVLGRGGGRASSGRPGRPGTRGPRWRPGWVGPELAPDPAPRRRRQSHASLAGGAWCPAPKSGGFQKSQNLVVVDLMIRFRDPVCVIQFAKSSRSRIVQSSFR